MGVKSNNTTPLRINDRLERSQKIHAENYNSKQSGKRDSSRLKQPTPLRRSAAVKATLTRIDSQSKLGNHDLSDEPYTAVTTRTSYAQHPCATPRIHDNAQPCLAKTARATGTMSAARQRPW